MIELAQEIIDSRFTKVTLDRFETIIRHRHNIESLQGDIIECGVWKGGMGIFLKKVFPQKNLWLADSFSGFEDPAKSKYHFKGERHGKGGMSVAYNDVIDAFKSKNIDTSDINFLVGYVNDTLPKADIQQLALLRVDVDAYSATLEVLEHLYDKVVNGGYIIFDDTCLVETRHAIKDFFGNRNINIELRHPVTDDIIEFDRGTDLPCGCYMIKE